jgi:hypothetical protein
MSEKRRRFQQSESLRKRLSDEAVRLREKAAKTPPGFEQDRLLRAAREAETAININSWLDSPGLQPPR